MRGAALKRAPVPLWTRAARVPPPASSQPTPCAAQQPLRVPPPTWFVAEASMVERMATPFASQMMMPCTPLCELIRFSVSSTSDIAQLATGELNHPHRGGKKRGSAPFLIFLMNKFSRS